MPIAWDKKACKQHEAVLQKLVAVDRSCTSLHNAVEAVCQAVSSQDCKLGIMRSELQQVSDSLQAISSRIMAALEVHASRPVMHEVASQADAAQLPQLAGRGNEQPAHAHDIALACTIFHGLEQQQVDSSSPVQLHCHKNQDLTAAACYANKPPQTASGNERAHQRSHQAHHTAVSVVAKPLIQTEGDHKATWMLSNIAYKHPNQCEVVMQLTLVHLFEPHKKDVLRLEICIHKAHQSQTGNIGSKAFLHLL